MKKYFLHLPDSHIKFEILSNGRVDIKTENIPLGIIPIDKLIQNLEQLLNTIKREKK